MGNIDQGELIGSYIGIIFLISLYTAIGIFFSSISQNPMIAFILTAIIILILYFGLNFLGVFYNILFFEYLSIAFHYESISRGIIDSRDVIYFISLIICFLYFSTLAIDRETT